MANFKEIYHFSRFQRGSNIFQGGGVLLFPGGGGGSNCLFPVETHITCDFPGGSGTALDLHLPVWNLASTCPGAYYGRPWPAVYIIFVQITHQIRVLTESLCRAQAILYALANNERGTKYHELT